MSLTTSTPSLIPVIINRKARQVRKRLNEIIDILEDSEYSLDVHIVSPKNFQTKLREIINQHPDRILVGGGDGTIVTAANKIAKTNIALGVLPLGTTNSFARSLDMPLDLPSALKIACTGTITSFNLGDVNGHHFVSVAAVGLSERVASTIPDSIKKRYGRFGYTIYGIYTFIKAKNFDATIKTDDNTYNFKSYHIVIGNARYHGSIALAQDANLAENELVILSFGNKGTKLEYLRNLVRYIRGTHDESKEVVLIKTTSAELVTPKSKRIEVDGEVLTKTPATIKLAEGALKVMVTNSI